MVADVFHPAYLTYDFGPHHPFSPVRLAMLVDLLDALGCPVHPELPEPATRAELLSVHGDHFVSSVEAAERGEPIPDPEEVGLGTPDDPVFPGMDLAARYLVGGTLLGARLIQEGRADVVLQMGGGLHHAQRDRASGFCVYNDVAVAIRHLLDRGLSVAYVDIDVHHGDGVQAIFYNTPDVLTVSLHESGQYLFPGTGEIYELGAGPGRGRAVNVPLEPFTEGESYLAAFKAVVPPVLSWFRADVLVVQAGADAHFGDPLADLLLTTRDYEKLFRSLSDLGRKFCRGKMIFTLGGGYDLASVPRVWALLYLVLHDLPIPEALPVSWRERWEQRLGVPLPVALHDPNPGYAPVERREEIATRNRSVTDRLLDSLMPYWYLAS
ncbi:MAG: acetoin utilization protein AcuC [Acidobacteriota bacterium]